MSEEELWKALWIWWKLEFYADTNDQDTLRKRYSMYDMISNIYKEYWENTCDAINTAFYNQNADFNWITIIELMPKYTTIANNSRTLLKLFEFEEKVAEYWIKK